MKPTKIRWWIVGMLTAFAFVSYLQRTNISVAAELMAPELHLSKVQMGQIFSSFLIGYAIFQVPWGYSLTGTARVLPSRLLRCFGAFARCLPASPPASRGCGASAFCSEVRKRPRTPSGRWRFVTGCPRGNRASPIR